MLVVITACCGGGAGACQTYNTADNLTGIACCDLTPFNSITHLCCDGAIKKRSDPSMYVDKCCGKNLLVPNQTCCNGTVHNVVNGDCCGTAVYSASESTYLCCEGNLSRTISPADKCCGPMAFDGGVQEICCGGKVSNKEHANSCCKLNDGSFVEYQSQTHFCCNGAIPKGAGLACCYLSIDGGIRAEPYNTDIHCCRHPYDILYPKINGTCTEQS
nr:Protein R12E2.8 [Haemonchus contortus]